MPISSIHPQISYIEYHTTRFVNFLHPWPRKTRCTVQIMLTKRSAPFQLGDLSEKADSWHRIYHACPT